jgi:hypothetical protein
VNRRRLFFVENLKRSAPFRGISPPPALPRPFCFTWKRPFRIWVPGVQLVAIFKTRCETERAGAPGKFCSFAKTDFCNAIGRRADISLPAGKPAAERTSGHLWFQQGSDLTCAALVVPILRISERHISRVHELDAKR